MNKITKSYISNLIYNSKEQEIYNIQDTDILYLTNDKENLNDDIIIYYKNNLHHVLLTYSNNTLKIEYKVQNINYNDLNSVLNSAELLVKHDQDFRIYNKVEVDKLINLGKEILDYENDFKDIDEKKKAAKIRIIEKLKEIIEKYTIENIEESKEIMNRFFDTKYLEITAI